MLAALSDLRPADYLAALGSLAGVAILAFCAFVVLAP